MPEVDITPIVFALVLLVPGFLFPEKGRDR